MAMEPKILVLDEPAAGLDPEGRDTILSQIRNYHEQTGITVILVSHSIDQIERMCNKVAWLDHGHLRRIGATKEITAEYRRFEKKDAMPAKVTEE